MVRGSKSKKTLMVLLHDVGDIENIIAMLGNVVIVIACNVVCSMNGISITVSSVCSCEGVVPRPNNFPCC